MNKLKYKREIHGYTGTITYISYTEMLKRCYNPKVIRYPVYGGRGIKVCDRWRESFLAFLEDMGERPSKKHSLDRIDNNGDYCPENCRWSIMKAQARNRTNNRLITYKNQTKTAVEWSEITGIPARIICQRIDRDGLTPEQALSKKREPGSGRYDEELY